MKRWIAIICIFTLFSLIFSFAASAETHTVAGGVQITLPEDYTLLTDETLKANEEIITELGHSLSSLRRYMEENRILFIAVDTQNQNQVQLGAFETDFSKDIGDLSGLKAEDLETIGSRIINGSFEIISVNNWVYYKTKVDGLVGYATVQYVTLKNGMLYTLNYYGSDSTVANEIISGLTLPAAKASGSSTLFISILLWVALVAALIIMVLLLFSLISDLRRSREDNDVREYIRIKRHWKL